MFDDTILYMGHDTWLERWERPSCCTVASADHANSSVIWTRWDVLAALLSAGHHTATYQKQQQQRSVMVCWLKGTCVHQDVLASPLSAGQVCMQRTTHAGITARGVGPHRHLGIHTCISTAGSGMLGTQV